MAERRPRKSDDNEETEKAYQILLKAMLDNPQIEPTLWAGAHLSALVTGYINSGITYEEFRYEMGCVQRFYKKRWKAS